MAAGQTPSLVRWRGSFARLAVPIAVFAMAQACFANSGQTLQSSPGIYQGYAPERYSEWTRQALYVPVGDGTRLAVTIYRPAEHGIPVSTKLPVLFAFTPYHARTRMPDGRIASPVEDGAHGTRPMVDMTRFGYVVVSADLRGKGASFGSRRGFQDRQEARDGP